MIAGPPNGGKSLISLWYACQNPDLGTLYISADTDSSDTFKRAAAMLSEDPVAEIEKAVHDGSASYYEELVEEALVKVAFSFSPSPTIDDIALEMDAYREVWGEYPALLIVDNAINVNAEHDDEWGGLRQLMKGLHHLARESNSCVMILHHVSEASVKNATKPAARRDIQGKIAQLPELILTTALDSHEDVLRVACVKNRSAKHDASGEHYIEIPLLLDVMQFFGNTAERQMFKQRKAYT